MNNRRLSILDGHNLGTFNEKGVNLMLANPLILKCRVAESNHGHEDFQSSALPTELTRHPELMHLYYNPSDVSRVSFFMFRRN
jgi:hypothetical protein